MDKILIVDDSRVQAHVLKQILDSEYEVIISTDATDVVALVEELRPSLVLLDIIMPDGDGFELLSRLRHTPTIHNVPVILITSLSGDGNEERGLTLGASDYIVKPYKPSVVRARVRTQTELYAYRMAMEDLIRRDGLTGIPNRRHYDERCKEEWFRAMRQSSPLSIGLLDIDFFKQYNDRYGHPSGDAVLRNVAQTAAAAFRRAGDFVARYGGEEFGFLLPDTPAESGEQMARALCADIRKLQLPHAASPVSPTLTVSVGGITVIPQSGEQFDDYLRMVDNMLYRAKHSGRNTVVWTAVGAV